MRTLHVTVGFVIVFHVVVPLFGSVPSLSRSHRHQHGTSGTVRSPATTAKQNTTCKQCEQRKLLKQFRLAKIQQQILEKLGFEHPPNVTAAQTARPKKIPMLAKMIRAGPGIQADQAYRDQQADPIEILTFSKSPNNTTSYGSSAVTFTLESKEATRSTLTSAAIWFKVRQNILNRWRRLKIKITKIGRPKPGTTTHSTKELSLKIIRAQNNRHEGWYNVDLLKQEVARWLRQATRTVVVKLEAFTMSGLPLAAVVTQPLSQGDDASMPFLAMNVKERRNTRRKRRLARICTEQSVEPNCCRYPLAVDFGNLGWDFIIAPRRYDANYCSGECPYKYMQRFPVTSLLSETTGAQVPCCTPTHLSPISMLYYNDKEEIIFGKLQGMVVERCGCS